MFRFRLANALITFAVITWVVANLYSVIQSNPVAVFMGRYPEWYAEVMIISEMVGKFGVFVYAICFMEYFEIKYKDMKGVRDD